MFIFAQEKSRGARRAGRSPSSSDRHVDWVAGPHTLHKKIRRVKAADLSTWMDIFVDRMGVFIIKDNKLMLHQLKPS